MRNPAEGNDAVGVVVPPGPCEERGPVARLHAVHHRDAEAHARPVAPARRLELVGRLHVVEVGVRVAAAVRPEDDAFFMEPLLQELPELHRVGVERHLVAVPVDGVRLLRFVHVHDIVAEVLAERDEHLHHPFAAGGVVEHGLEVVAHAGEERIDGAVAVVHAEPFGMFLQDAREPARRDHDAVVRRMDALRVAGADGLHERGELIAGDEPALRAP